MVIYNLFCRDWYNLEKSKRVKAFRCCEFDDYIEKIEEKREICPAWRCYSSCSWTWEGIEGNDDDEKHVNLKSYMSCENEIAGGCFPLEVARDVEVDLSEATPQTRGLQDVGIKIARKS